MCIPFPQPRCSRRTGSHRQCLPASACEAPSGRQPPKWEHPLQWACLSWQRKRCTALRAKLQNHTPLFPLDSRLYTLHTHTTVPDSPSPPSKHPRSAGLGPNSASLAGATCRPVTSVSDSTSASLLVIRLTTAPTGNTSSADWKCLTRVTDLPVHPEIGPSSASSSRGLGGWQPVVQRRMLQVSGCVVLSKTTYRSTTG